eukprot:2017420-Rhodomonas_salina.1
MVAPGDAILSRVQRKPNCLQRRAKRLSGAASYRPSSPKICKTPRTDQAHGASRSPTPGRGAAHAWTSATFIAQDG